MWFTLYDAQVKLKIFAKPHAKHTKFLKISDDGLHITLHAKPHAGAANKELISYLAKLLDLPKSYICLQQGESSRYKIIVIPMTTKVQEFLDDPMQFITNCSLK